MISKRTIFVVDDDAKLRASVCALAASMGYHPVGFASAEEFLANHSAADRGVVVVDLRMPSMSGLELQEQLLKRKSHLPIIILTAYARTATTVRAMQAGAVTIIDKPYHDDDLWEAIRTALDKEEEAWRADWERREIRERLATLTAEENRVAELLVAGSPNKTIAHLLGIALRTVEKRRHAILTKMKAGSIAELVRIWLEAQSLG